LAGLKQLLALFSFVATEFYGGEATSSSRLSSPAEQAE